MWLSDCGSFMLLPLQIGPGDAHHHLHIVDFRTLNSYQFDTLHTSERVVAPSMEVPPLDPSLGVNLVSSRVSPLVVAAPDTKGITVRCWLGLCVSVELAVGCCSVPGVNMCSFAWQEHGWERYSRILGQNDRLLAGRQNMGMSR